MIRLELRCKIESMSDSLKLRVASKFPENRLTGARGLEEK